MQNDKLLPCPFCDKKLKKFKGGYEHKSSQCVLSSFILTDVEIPKWNTRKPMERIVERLDELENITLDQYNNSMAGTYEHDFADGKDCGLSMAIDIVRNGGKE